MTVNHSLEPIYDRNISKLKHFPKGVIVFDRDGTLVEDAGQHNDIALLKFLPGAAEAIKLLSEHGYGIAIASNQSGLESKKFNLSTLLEFNHALRVQLHTLVNADIDLIAVCPHLASSNCCCRKPEIGLLKGIEMSGLGNLRLFVGDTLSDKNAAKNFRLSFLLADGVNLAKKIEEWINSECA